jgi:hypothetical protein
LQEALDLPQTHWQRRGQLKPAAVPWAKNLPLMPSLKIPDEALPDLKKIAELEQEFFDSLLKAVSEAEPTLTRSQFENKISAKVASADKSAISTVLKTTLFFYRLKENAQISTEELGEAVLNSAVVSSSDKFTEETKKALKNRLTQLLNLDKTLGVTSKALDVMTEHERIFCTARILSDIRPVFSANAKDASGAVIIHNLQIGYHQDGKHTEFYVALDTSDIQKLKKVIERAEEKTLAMEAMLKRSTVPYLEA